MNSLDKLNALKIKPLVRPPEGVKINIIVQNPAVTSSDRSVITANKDQGERAKDILDKIRKKSISSVVKKFPEPAIIQDTKAPVINVSPPKKSRKLDKGTIIIEEENEPTLQILPEGGPRVVEEGDEEEMPVPVPLQIGEIVEPNVEEDILPKKIRERSIKKVQKGTIPLGPLDMVVIGDTLLTKRLPPIETTNVKSSSYYMNNREIFVNFINGLFEPYRDELLDESKGITCEDIGKDTGEVSLLTHQKIVRDYINLHTPYRGLLLFHGLGSGKTCSSIAIAEGIKSKKQVIILTPASLRRNYIEEIKKCGDTIYRKNQFWEWISLESNPELLITLSKALQLPTQFISRYRGAWLVNITKASNYNELSTTDKKSLNNQLEEMINNKYKFINYNGLRREKFNEMTKGLTENIFDNSVVIIDEAHNLISRIVNKINKISKFSSEKRGPNSNLSNVLALQIYELLLRAEDCRIVLLTGTPIVNYPNEIAILFNMLRGYIKTWSFTLETEGTNKLSNDALLEIFAKEKVLDYVDYSSGNKTLTITRNPYGFENLITYSKDQRNETVIKYKGVTNESKVKKTDDGKNIYEERGTLSDTEFIEKIIKILRKNDIKAVTNGTSFSVNTALPDTLEEFINNFIDKQTGDIINADKLKRRIIGLTSYFRSAQEELLPKYDRSFDKHDILIPMSDYQFKVYEEYRSAERKSEKPNKKTAAVIDSNGLFKEPSSTYRIFSRLACNFVMPNPPGRPIPLNFIATNVSKTDKEDINKPEANLVNANVVDAKVVENNNIPKAQSKLEKEQTKREKEQAKLEKEELKAQSKREKEQAKLEKEELKAQAKREKEELKKSKKGGDASSESDDETDEMSQAGGGDLDLDEDANVAQSFMDGKNDEPVELAGYKDVDASLRNYDELEGDEVLEKMGNVNYREAIVEALRYLKLHSREFLSPEGLKTYSPKFLAMLENIEDNEHQGLHLVYSQFRSMEGIGIFSMTLDTNGFAQFKIKKTSIDKWEINMSEEDMGKPCYALYTGTEESEEREILRNIYNGQWDYIPNNIATQLKAKSRNNDMGEIIKVLMITSAGSEGINLRNTRYVHIMEPYWHPVRVEQVIGRARRICSHQNLPKELQTVEVFTYIMTFTPQQLDSEFALELRLKDLSKRAPFVPQSSDEKLFEISTIKEQLSTQLLKCIKEASIDCATYSKASSKEGLVCLSFGQPTVNSFSYNPNYAQDENDTVAAINRVTINWEAKEIRLPNGKKYILRADTQQVYDYDSVIEAKKIPGLRPILLGKLVKNSNGKYEIVKERF